jgi:hypothetical protein
MWMEMSLNLSTVNNPSLEQWALHVACNITKCEMVIPDQKLLPFFIMQTTFKFQETYGNSFKTWNYIINL